MVATWVVMAASYEARAFGIHSAMHATETGLTSRHGVAPSRAFGARAHSAAPTTHQPCWNPRRASITAAVPATPSRASTTTTATRSRTLPAAVDAPR